MYREIRQFLDLLLRPKTALTGIKHANLLGTLRFNFVIGTYVLLNILFLGLQEIGTEYGTWRLIRGSYLILFEFMVLITAYLPGYLIGLILLSKISDLGQAVRSLLYAGGGFLILHISAQSALKQKYTFVLNGIRREVFAILTGVDHSGVGWQYTVTGGDQPVNPLEPGQTVAEVVYSQPPLVEMLTAPMAAIWFGIWVGSFGYFLYLLFLDARINHRSTQLEAALIILISIWMHALILTADNPLGTFFRGGLPGGIGLELLSKLFQTTIVL